MEVPESKIDGKVARNLDRDNMLCSTLGTFCSVTVGCARCHDHKFDPITQDDYYALQAIFAAVDRADRPYAVDPVAAEPDGTGEKKIPAGSDPPQAGGLVYAAATEFPPQGNFKPTHGIPRPIFVLQRGNVQSPLYRVQPRIWDPGFMPQDDQTIAPADPGDAASEGRWRAALAQWIASRDNPLTWRSIANRIWLHHFDQALVSTPNDFGRMGARPTHPELLDWMAAQLRDGRLSLKDLHRMIVRSSVYLQSSMPNEAHAAVDGSNQLLWRMPRRRLEAEALRDAILSVSGLLDCSMGGPGFYLFQLEKTEHSPHFEYHKYDPQTPGTHRRSIYRFIVRSQPNPWLTAFDCADTSQSTPVRSETLTPLQALSLMNSPWTLFAAEWFARRLECEAGSIESQVARGFALVVQREWTDIERKELMSYANRHGLENTCRVLLNLNEFLFVD